jgi:hypothetical protein
VLDLDGCRDPHTGTIHPDAALIVAKLASYTEVSPSGTGVHVWCKAQLPKGGRRYGPIELYDSGRYMTVTGIHVAETPLTIEARSEQLASLHTSVFAPRDSPDADLVDAATAFAAQNDTSALGRLWRGEIRGDHSKSDFALCRELAKRVGLDETRIDRLLRKSALMRKKWDEPRRGETYGQRTIRQALKTQHPADSITALPGRRSGSRPVLVNLADVVPELVEWLWPWRVAAGKTTLICGDPGLGKSWIALDIAARLSSGRVWPDGSASGEPANVLLLSAEDGLSDTIRPRLDALGANVSRITAVSIVQSASEPERGIQLSDLEALEIAVKDASARVVIIDPITAYLGDTDSHRDAAVRALLAPIALLAERLRFALVAVMHLGKSTQRAAVYRPGGSIAFTAFARIVLAVAQLPDRDDRRVLVPVKNNLSSPPPALAYTIADGALTWEPEPVLDCDVEALLSGLPGKRSQRRETDTWLSALLTKGPVEVRQIRDEATAAGVAWRSVTRAKARLRVRSFRRGFSRDGQWFWALPDSKDATGEQQGALALNAASDDVPIE